MVDWNSRKLRHHFIIHVKLIEKVLLGSKPSVGSPKGWV